MSDKTLEMSDKKSAIIRTSNPDFYNAKKKQDMLTTKMVCLFSFILKLNIIY